MVSGVDGSIIHTLNGVSTEDRFGFTVDGIADATGDGVPDVIVGAPNWAGGGVRRGYVRLYSGATGAVAREFKSTVDSDSLGYSVSGLGDVNNDGLAELIFGAWQRKPDGSYIGSGYIDVHTGVPAPLTTASVLGIGCGGGRRRRRCFPVLPHCSARPLRSR